MASQYGEHTQILEHFAGRVGRFLDVGAFDGVTFSNTRCLAETGWSGVLVEPSPPAFCWLMKNYDGNPNVELINAAIVERVHAQDGEDVRLIRFSVNTSDAYSADMLSTLMESHKAKFPRHPWRQIRIPALTWEELFRSLPGSYDFINIDVEGLNEELLNALPVGRNWPEMICIELDPAARQQAMSDRLTQYGLTFQRCFGGNLLAWR